MKGLVLVTSSTPWLAGSESQFLCPGFFSNAEQFLEVSREFEIGLGDYVEARDFKVDLGIRRQYLSVTSSLSIEFGERERCLARIPDLSAVPSCVWVLLIIAHSSQDYVCAVDLDFSLVFVKALLNEIEVQLENSFCLYGSQSWIIEADMNSTSKCLIDDAHSIRGQKQDPSIVL